MKPVFLVGAPRSGTTWLQLILYQHPLVATTQETHLFDWYLANLQRMWTREEKRQIVRGVGLRHLLTDAEFKDVLEYFTHRVMQAIVARKPGAEVVLEKTPAHIQHWELIHALLPEAKFIHLMRDPRAVVASLKRVANSWGGDWAPRTAVDGALMWAEAIAQRSTMRETLGDLYKEVRYEDLRRDPVTQVDALFQWLGLGSDRRLAESAVTACAADKLGREANDVEHLPWDPSIEPTDFYRKMPTDSWRGALSRRDINTVEFVNRQAMTDLGYRCEINLKNRKPWGLATRDLLATSLSHVARIVKQRAPWMIKIAESVVRD